MKDKKITLAGDARKGLISGIKKLDSAVGSTLGPNGTTVVIEAIGKAVVTKDGVSVASQIQLADPIENLGLTMVKQASQQAAKLAGDGTTTATILTSSIIEMGDIAVSTGANANGVKRGIELARDVYLDKLDTDFTKTITEEKEILSVATISSNNKSFAFLYNSSLL